MTAGKRNRHRIPSQIRRERYLGAGILCVGAAFCGLAIRAAVAGQDFILLSGAGAALALYGRRVLTSTAHRRFGLELEAQAAAAAARVLPRCGLVVERNRRMPGLGDADLVVGLEGAGELPVEIKSFGYWDPKEGRSRAALAQVQRLQERIGSPWGCVWLPQARVGFWRRWFGKRHGRVWVAFGSPRNMARVTRRLLRR